MTQCILSYILNDHHENLNKHHLESFYNDCLKKDEYLDHFEIVQKETNAHRRHINPNNSKNFFKNFIFRYYFFFFVELYYYDPYTSITKADNIYLGLGNSFGIPLYTQSRLSPLVQEEPEEGFYVDGDDIILQQSPGRMIAQESIMSNLFYLKQK